MLKHLLSLICILVIVFTYIQTSQPIPEVLGESTETTETLPVEQPVLTETRFGFKYETETDTLPHETINRDNPEAEYGTDEIIQKGSDGKKTKTIKITYYEGKEFAREVTKTETTEPVNEIVSRGTKLVWRTLDTPDGQIRYWKKMRVYATHYDQHCLGCNEWTAIGMRAGKGVIAVDPKVIKMRSSVYIPGYGKAIAGDTGGAIKGNIIDLGFDDARTAGWSARYVDIYLLDKEPN
jgi:3D (Asp-Asp-Asp) domain-containing protein